MADLQIDDSITWPMLSVTQVRGTGPVQWQALLAQLVGTRAALHDAPRFSRAGVCTLIPDAPGHLFVRYDVGAPPAGALPGHCATVTDVTEGWQTFCIRGPGARDLLAKGTRVDLHAGAATQCFFRTSLAEVPVILLLHEQDCEVMVPRSYGAWMLAWLQHAAGLHGEA